MSDLISRQAAIDAIWTHATNILENSDYDLFIQDIYKMTHRHIAELIQHLPSAEPVKYGQWISDGPVYPHGICWMHCSVCGRKEVEVPATKTAYCPHCGAKMDL